MHDLPSLFSMSESLVVNEIYLSLQGESTFAGLPCIFVRLTGCDLRCSYCDTAYAFREGRRMALADIHATVRELASPFGAAASGRRLPLVEVTGGEPLLQKAAVPVMAEFCHAGFTVLLETGGAHDISRVDARVHRILDLKCPSSGECGRNRLENLDYLTSADEVKFVIGTEEDYAWAKAMLFRHELASRCPVLFSSVTPLAEEQRHPSLNVVPPEQVHLARRDLAERIVAESLPVRFQLQMHKFVWEPERRGV